MNQAARVSDFGFSAPAPDFGFSAPAPDASPATPPASSETSDQSAPPPAHPSSSPIPAPAHTPAAPARALETSCPVPRRSAIHPRRLGSLAPQHASPSAQSPPESAANFHPASGCPRETSSGSGP